MNNDSVRQLLLDLAERSYPDIFSGSIGKPLRLSRPYSPAIEANDVPRCIEALESDPLLKVFAGIGTPPFVIDSLAGGELLQGPSLFRQLVGSAVHELLARGKSTESSATFLDMVDRHLQAFREMISGRTVEVLVLTPFEGFKLEAGTRVNLPWGTVRPAAQYDTDIEPYGVAAPTAVMESVVPCRMIVGESPSSVDLFDKDSLELLRDRSLRLTLGLLLAFHIDHSSPVATEGWRTILIPGKSMPGYSGETTVSREFAREPMPVLRDAEIEQLESWVQRIEDHYHSSINVAAHRLVVARQERSSTYDSLIDSIVAWENLFGHGATSEVKFRVTAALAVLLANGPEEREGLRRAFGKIYDRRSRLVHGADMRGWTAWPDADRAFEVAIEALRKLFTRAPGLLADRERGIKLIMGGGVAPYESGQKLPSTDD